MSTVSSPMLAAIRSAAVLGIEAYAIIVEVDVAAGLPAWTIVGLAGGAVKEARERVSAAIVNSGFELPSRRVTVNLSPADVRKEGTAFDLPIALGLLTATGKIDAAVTAGLVVAGELGLDGAIRPIRGALSLARAAARSGARALVVPESNAAEAALVSSVRVVTAPNLRALLAMLSLPELPPSPVLKPAAPLDSASTLDFADVIGQPLAKRALEIAAAGGHNALLVGPPGAGKTMLARRLPGILPQLTEDELLEVVAVHSVGGVLPPGAMPSRTPPFRAPHHTISTAGLIGGGPGPRPGEVSLAHRGLLFLDELLELPRHVLDAMRQPLEDGRVVIVRAAQAIAFPARFQLIGAANPCPCGRTGDPTLGSLCCCSVADIERYRARLSGPLADRIDMHVQVSAVAAGALQRSSDGESSAVIRERVSRAREMQRERYVRQSDVSCNAQVAGRWLLAQGGLTDEARALLHSAVDSLRLSARGFHRVLRIARTVADLEAAAAVTSAHVAECLAYRPR